MQRLMVALIAGLMMLFGGLAQAQNESLQVPATAGTGIMVTASLSGAQTESLYQLTWGDGATEEFYILQGSTTKKHTYGSPGTYDVVLSRRINQNTFTPVARSKIVISPPVPTFSVTPTEVQPNQQVTTTLGNVSGSISYKIDWGDGIQNPVDETTGLSIKHAYTALGTYTVKLTYPGGAPQTQIVRVVAPPCTLEAVPSPATVGSPVAVKATGLLTSFNGVLDWGDGTQDPFNTGNLTNYIAGHTYTAARVATIKVLSGGIPICALALQVTVPMATLNVTPTSAQVNQQVTAALGNLVSSVTYTLDWGDGQNDTVTGQATSSVKHNYAAPGTFVVKLTAPSTTPQTQTVTVIQPACALQVTPSPATPGANITAKITGLPANFTGSIDWGDTTNDAFTANGTGAFTATHAFNTVKTYVIKVLSGTTAICTASLQVAVPNPTLAVAPTDLQVNQQTTATLGNLISSVTYTLAWGDGQTDTVNGQTTANIKHAYAAPGTFVVKLTAPGTAPQAQTVMVIQPTCTIQITPVPTILDANITAKINGLPNAFAGTIDWGDTTSDAFTANANGAFTATHAFNTAKTYVVKVLSGTTPICTASVQITIPTPSLVVAPAEVQIDQQVTANIGNLISSVNYTIDWGDTQNEPVTGQATASIKHAYAKSGTFIVKLTAAGIVPQTQTVLVILPSCTLEITPNPGVPGAPITASIKDLPGAQAITIDWGDTGKDAINSAQNGTATAKHTFDAPKLYVIKVLFGTTPICTGSVQIVIPQATLSVTPDTIQPGQSVTANLGNLVSSLTYTIEWSDGDTDTVTGKTSASIKHTYDKLGTFVVKLTVVGGVPQTQPVNVKFPDPTETITATPNPPIIDQQVTFKLANLIKGQAYTLDYGDLSSDSITAKADGTASTKHTFAKTKTYVVQLTLDAGNKTQPRATLPLKVSPVPQAQIDDVSIEWIKPYSGSSAIVPLSSGKLSAAVTVKFKGGPDTLEGAWWLDGKLLEQVSIDLIPSQRNGSAKISDLPTDVPGTHKLEFRYSAIPQTPGTVILVKVPRIATPIIYFVPPNSFQIGGFVIQVTDVDAGSTADDFSGKGEMGLVVAGVQLEDLKEIGFKNLKLSFFINNSSLIQSKAIPQVTSGIIKIIVGKTVSPIDMAATKIKVDALELSPSGGKAIGLVEIPFPTCDFKPKAPENLQTKPDDPETAFAKMLAFIKAGGPKGGGDPYGEYGDKGGAPILSPAELIASGAAKWPATPKSDFGPPVPKPSGGLKMQRPGSGKSLKKAQVNPPNPESKDNFPFEIKLDDKIEPGTGNIFATKDAYTSDEIKKYTGRLFLNCSPVVILSQYQAVTLDLSLKESPKKELLAVTYHASTNPPDLGPAWRGVYFQPTQMAFDRDGNTAKEDFLEPMSYGTGGYNLELVASNIETQANSWKISTDCFYVGMVSSEITLGFSTGTVYIPFLEETLKAEAGIGTNSSSIVTTGEVRHNFGKAGIDAGPATFVNGKNGYVIQFADALWTAGFLTKASKPAGTILEKRRLSASPRSAKRVQGTSYKSPYANSGNVPSNGMGGKPSESATQYKTVRGSLKCQLLANNKAKQIPNTQDTTQIFYKIGLTTDQNSIEIQPLVDQQETNSLPGDDLNIALHNLQISYKGDATLDGQDWQPIYKDGQSALELNVLNNDLTMTEVGVGGGYLRLQGTVKIAEFGESSDSADQTVTGKTIVTYRVSNGQDTSLGIGPVMIDSIGGTHQEVKISTVKLPEKVFAINSLGLASKHVPAESSTVSKARFVKVSKSYLNSSGDYEFDAGTGSIDMGDVGSSSASAGIKAKVGALFGRKNGKSYWYVSADFESKNAPLGSFLTIVNVHGLFGGVAYNMDWSGSSVQSRKQKPVLPGGLPSGGLQVQAGAVFAVEDGSLFHGAGVVKFELSGSISVLVDGWLATSMSSGYFSSSNPQARGFLELSRSGVTAGLCLGPSSGGNIDCTDLSKLNYKGIVSVSGYVALKIGGSDSYLYIGAVTKPIQIKVSKLGEADGYVLLGRLHLFALPDSAKKLDNSLGFFVGARVKFGCFPGKCKDGWSTLICDFSYEIIAYIDIYAEFSIAISSQEASIHAGIEVEAGVGGSAYACGIGGSISVTATIRASVTVTTSSFTLNEAEICLTIPFIDDDECVGIPEIKL